MKRVLFLALFLLPLSAGAQTAPANLAVRYRSAETIYLDAGKAAGVDVGDRLEVVRNGKAIAEIEVIFAAERSASCKILSERETIQPGDRVRLVGDTAPPPQPAAPGPSKESAPAPRPASPRTTERTAGEDRSFRRSRTGISGTLRFQWESFADGSDDGRDSDRTGARLNLRVRDIAGSPFQLRLRMRTLDVSRERTLTGGIPDNDSRDRLYEASLSYDDPDGYVGFRVGRLGTSPFVGIGYLDGGLAQFQRPTFAVGGFYGRNPELEELGFESSGSKAGVFLRATPSGRDSLTGLDFLLAGVREEGDVGISREYAVVETRYSSGERWSFYEHAEIDLNRDWREFRSSEEAQLSNIALTALARLSERNRLSISYERFQPYLTEETRFIPEELFDNFARQGLRVSWQGGGLDSLNYSLTAGLRNRENAVEDRLFSTFDAKETYFLGLGVGHPRLPGLGISVGATATGYSSSSFDGLIVTTRAGRRLGSAGHELSLALGGNLSRQAGLEEENALYWGRAALWLELPYDLFGEAEIEVLTGDDIDGQRLSLGLGYRF